MINSGPEASNLLRQLVRMTGYPITSTLMGLGAYPASSKHWLGMLGMHGTAYANKAMVEADLIMSIGSRFDDRIIGKADQFGREATIIHIDKLPLLGTGKTDFVAAKKLAEARLR